MKTLAEYMDKSITLVTTDGKQIVGDCLGVYGSVQNEDDYGRAEASLEIHHDGSAVMVFESEIKSILVN
jgi:hypothetical protein